MHPLGIYLAITNSQPEHGRGQASERRPAWARVDAMQIYVRPTLRTSRRLTNLRHSV
jgi:hypothetical protein